MNCLKFKVLALCLLASFFLCGCEEYYSSSYVDDAKQQSYNDGYRSGYEQGMKDQEELDYERFCIDGTSINTIVDRIYREYGITPADAFTMYDEYNYDSSHGGITWSEYNNAIEAIFATASIFPDLD